jgi:predicted nucleic acid-binding protein
VTTYVIDASVAVKWVLPAKHETLSAEAFQLLNAYVAGEVRFIVPDLFWAEFANVLWKASRQRRLSVRDSEAFLRSATERAFPTFPTLTLLEDAFAIATAFDRTVYDALYVALAVRFKSQLITADEALANTLAAHMPVKWLGSL